MTTTKLFTDLNANFFAALTDHAWNVLFSRWSRGSDWCTQELQDRVQVLRDG